MQKYLKLVAVILVLGVCGYLFKSYVATDAMAEKTMDDKQASSWAVRCNEVADGEAVKPGQCEMFQKQTVKESGQRLIELAIGYSEDEGNARGVAILPLGILLQPGVLMQVDEETPFRFSVRHCDAGGCFAYLNMNEAVIETLKKGKKANIIMAVEGGKKVNIVLPLNGFTKKWKEISGS